MPCILLQRTLKRTLNFYWSNSQFVNLLIDIIYIMHPWCIDVEAEKTHQGLIQGVENFDTTQLKPTDTQLKNPLPTKESESPCAESKWRRSIEWVCDLLPPNCNNFQAERVSTASSDVCFKNSRASFVLLFVRLSVLLPVCPNLLRGLPVVANGFLKCFKKWMLSFPVCVVLGIIIRS